MRKIFVSVLATILWMAISLAVPVQKANAQSKLKIVEIKDGVKTETEVVLPDTVHDTQILKGDISRLITSLKDGSSLSDELFLTENPDSIKRMIIVRNDGDDMNGQVKEMVRVFEYRNDSNEFRTVTRRPRYQRGVPVLPPPGERPLVRRLRSDRSNVIRLDDPAILTFKKKNLRNGREKITIIREKNHDVSSVDNLQFVNPDGDVIRINRQERIGELEIKDRESRQKKEMIELDLRK
ncbi:MAG TPA: hypothetical protein DCY35_04015 [Prolixibacteraceae bacterium]|nr:hypothetical protein [Prolixibacteraceae bacterium]